MIREILCKPAILTIGRNETNPALEKKSHANWSLVQGYEHPKEDALGGVRICSDFSAR